MIADSFLESRTTDVVDDFAKTFYPSVVGLDIVKDNAGIQVTEGLEAKSFDTFGGLTNDMITLDGAPLKVARYRTPDQHGFGVFQHIGGDLSLFKPENEDGHTPALPQIFEGPAVGGGFSGDIRDLCTKIYRSTNMRYQQLAKLILRNKGDEIRRQVQMKFVYRIEAHLSLTITKLQVQNNA